MSATPRRDRLLVASALIGAAVAPGVLLLVIPTLFTFATGRYTERIVFTSTSPDGRYRLVGAERADFPANEVLDPSATLFIRLTDVTTGQLLDQFSFESFEYWDFNEKATVSWQADGRVRVAEIDTRGHHVSAILDVRALRGLGFVELIPRVGLSHTDVGFFFTSAVGADATPTRL